MKTALLIFSKIPTLGEVKTRLGKSIGMEQSQWVYMELLKHTANVSKKSKLTSVLFENKISAEKNALFAHASHHRVQEGKNLGEKMKNAFCWAFDQDYKKVILIGSDLWTLHQDTLIEAQQALEHNDFVIGPSYDGGYYLIGMKNLDQPIFENIPWSTSKVFKETLHRISASRIHYLEIANDIDDLKDLKANPTLYNLYQKQFPKNS